MYTRRLGLLDTSPISEHTGFDPDYELIKNTRTVSTKTPDERIVYLVMAIELEVISEQFRLCCMPQNRAVVENKRVLPVLVPGPGTILLLAGS